MGVEGGKEEGGGREQIDLSYPLPPQINFYSIKN